MSRIKRNPITGDIETKESYQRGTKPKKVKKPIKITPHSGLN